METDKVGRLFLPTGSPRRLQPAHRQTQGKSAMDISGGCPSARVSGQFMTRGVYGQYIYVDQTADVVIVTTSTDKLFLEPGADDANVDVVCQIIATSKGSSNATR